MMGGPAENMENIGPATDPTMNDKEFTDNRLGQALDTGEWNSAYRYPQTGEWAGGKSSRHE